MSSRFYTFFGTAAKPLILAPLAGVSDGPFRRICQHFGADLTYVEMLSGKALVYGSQKSLWHLKRHETEKKLGVQVTAAEAETMGPAIALLNKYAFDAIDINMGCPVNKVVKSGCGSALLKDSTLVYKITRAARQETDKPLSVKIRLGWDHASRNYLEVGRAIKEAGADWVTLHGRTRSDDYSCPVDLQALADFKRRCGLPVIGNGNLFSRRDITRMAEESQVDGFMISRGSLGNPWIFHHIKSGEEQLSLETWYEAIMKHIYWQKETYGTAHFAAACMRKHYLWYTKSWPQSRVVRQKLSEVETLDQAQELISEFYRELQHKGITQRVACIDHIQSANTYHNHDHQNENDERMEQNSRPWDPKYDMDRQLDRGVGTDGME